MLSHQHAGTDRVPRSGSASAASGRIVLGVIVVMVFALLAGTVGAQEKGHQRGRNELRLELVDTQNPRVVAIHPDSGWQITALFRAKENRLLGIGVPYYPPLFPHTDVTGFLVFKDPDNCPSFLDFGGEIMAYESYYCYSPQTEAYPGCVPPYWPDDDLWPTGQPQCAPPEEGARTPWVTAISDSGVAWPKDETWVEITPGLSIPDFVPNVTPVGGLEKEQPPVVWFWNGDAWALTSVGPDLGSTDDDTRFGSWRRMPGLVVLANHGPGARTVPPGENDISPAPDFFDKLRPAEAWNLAGLFHSSTYSLKGGSKETSILAHINVPYGLFKPVVLVDKELSIGKEDDFGVFCDGTNALYRLDGGPLTCAIGGLSHTDQVLTDTVVTVRVFMVDGEAPNVLVDQDWDGDVDIRDAELLGLNPVSNESTTRFKQYHELECGIPYDFDGDGDAGGCVLGARPGGITRPPR